MARNELVPVECVHMPKILFRDPRYIGLSADAKLLYSLLLDRKNVAGLNEWIDPMGTPYVIYPKSEMKRHLNASSYRVDAALEELAACDQMVLVTQPNPGRPCQIYVKDIAGNYDMKEETIMTMMMKEKENAGENTGNVMGMMPITGIPGFQGVALMMNPGDMDQVMEDLGDLGEILGSLGEMFSGAGADAEDSESEDGRNEKVEKRAALREKARKAAFAHCSTCKAGMTGKCQTWEREKDRVKALKSEVSMEEKESQMRQMAENQRRKLEQHEEGKETQMGQQTAEQGTQTGQLTSEQGPQSNKPTETPHRSFYDYQNEAYGCSARRSVRKSTCWPAVISMRMATSTRMPSRAMPLIWARSWA